MRYAFILALALVPHAQRSAPKTGTTPAAKAGPHFGPMSMELQLSNSGALQAGLPTPTRTWVQPDGRVYTLSVRVK